MVTPVIRRYNFLYYMTIEFLKQPLRRYKSVILTPYVVKLYIAKLRSFILTVCQAVAKRINQLLIEKNMTQYRLEKESGIQHGTMNSIMSARNKGIELNTVMMIAAGFNMTVIEFLDDPIFESENLEIE